jgi:hypothetical protein
MSTLLTSRPAIGGAHAGEAGAGAGHPAGGDARAGAGANRPRWKPESGPTLDDVVSRTWEVLRAGVPAACVVCGAELEPRHSSGAGLVGARCDSCGTMLG